MLKNGKLLPTGNESKYRAEKPFCEASKANDFCLSRTVLVSELQVVLLNAHRRVFVELFSGESFFMSLQDAFESLSCDATQVSSIKSELIYKLRGVGSQCILHDVGRVRCKLAKAGCYAERNPCNLDTCKGRSDLLLNAYELSTRPRLNMFV